MKRMFWLLLFLASPAWATTYYVGKSGSDANSCATAQSSTAGNRKLTITGASGGFSCLSSGDTLIVGAGTYSEGIDNSGAHFPPSGTSGQHTTLQGETGAVVVINGLNADGDAIARFPTNYLTIDNIDFNGGALSGITVVILGYGGGAETHDVTITNSKMHNTGGAAGGGCFWTSGAGSASYNITLDNDDFYDCTGADNQSGHAVYLRSKDSTLSNSRLYNCHADCLHIYTSGFGIDVTNVRIFNNVIHDSGYYGVTIANASGLQFYNNLVYHNGQFNGSTGGIRTYDGANNTLIYNNTVYGNTGTGLCGWGTAFMGGSTGTQWKNNIVYNNSVADIDISNCQGTGAESGATTATNLSGTNPLFVDQNSNDYHLQCHSPAIDTGSSLAGVVDLDFDGTSRPVDGGACGDGTSGYDIGAYEYIASQAPPPPPPYTGTPSKKPRLRIRIK